MGERKRSDDDEPSPPEIEIIPPNRGYKPDADGRAQHVFWSYTRQSRVALPSFVVLLLGALFVVLVGVILIAAIGTLLIWVPLLLLFVALAMAYRHILEFFRR